jgi:hypothetical protein
LIEEGRGIRSEIRKESRKKKEGEETEERRKGNRSNERKITEMEICLLKEY